MRFVVLALVVLASACAALSRTNPADVAADALAAQAAATELAHQGCAAYESAVASRVVRADGRVSGQCAALRE